MFEDIKSNQKPRERFLEKGGETLSEAELLALILQTGFKQVDVMTLSYNLLSKYGGLKNLIDQPLYELQTNKGIGETKAIKLKSIYYISQLMFQVQDISYKINNANDIYQKLKFMENKEEENFYIMCLKNNNELITLKHIFKGNINSVMISPREILKEALLVNSKKICLIHNHPSGDLLPSVADIRSTEQMLEISALIGINIIDHIIVGKGNYFSMQENMLLDFQT